MTLPRRLIKRRNSVVAVPYSGDDIAVMYDANIGAYISPPSMYYDTVLQELRDGMWIDIENITEDERRGGGYRGEA